jgi:hypothetical protein
VSRPTLHPPSSLFARVRALLEGRRLPLFAALVGALLVSPSLFAGLATEDWVQRALIQRGEAPLPSHLNLFGHSTHWTPADTLKRDFDYQLFGWFPWLTDKHFDASFWRPLASLTHHIDYRVWPNHPWIMHTESVLLYGATIVAVALFHRRLIEPKWTAGLASMLYAIDDAHGHPVGWLTNRNGLMATLFAVLSLVSYDRFRREGRTSGAFLTVLFLGLALGSAEFALSVAGYFVAYLLFVDDARISRRLLAASTWVVPFIAWGVVYRKLGHATHGSGLYIDPLRDPLSYTFELVERCTVLLMGQIGAPFADTWAQSTAYFQGLLVFWAAMLVWAVAWTLWPLLRHDRRARFWAAGLVLSLLPAGATFPEDRLLLLAGVGAFPLVASSIGALVERPAWLAARKRSAVLFGWASLLLHATIAPLLLPYRSLRMFRYERELKSASDSAFSHVTRARGEALILVNAEDYYSAGMATVARVSRGESTIARMLTLAGTLSEVVIRRPDEYSLEVRPTGGFLSREFNRIYRSRTAPFTRGERIDLLGVEVTVTEVNQWGEPLVALFTFALPLEHARYKWVVWKNGHYEPFVPPAVGSSVEVGGA